MRAPMDKPSTAPGWSPTSWQSKPARQLPVYADPAALERTISQLSQLPPIVVSWEVEQLKQQLSEMDFHGEPEAALEESRLQRLVLERIARQLQPFPGYAHVYRAHLELEPWCVDNGLLTPTMKIRRSRIMEHYSKDIELLYSGH